MVVRSVAGLGRAAPLPGEAPELRLEVDTTPPVIYLYPVEADPRRKDTLVLLWSVTDRNLAPAPITLQWAEQPGGPWQTIAAGLTNNTGPQTGRHLWQMPAKLPYRVYLRLEARDQAGNVGWAETPEPVLVDLVEPEIRIKGISVAGQKSHNPPPPGNPGSPPPNHLLDGLPPPAVRNWE
jgi:hypothetical protein